MKNLFKYACIFICTGILFTSCSHESSISLTKRHYRNGYYVERTSKSNAKQNEQEKVYSKQSVFVSPKIDQPVITDDVLANADKISENKQGDANHTTSFRIKQVDRKAVIKAILPGFSKIKTQLNTVKSLLENKNKIKKIQDTPGDDARSFFWIVITVLLILWLLGFIAGGWGLGNLINLLLAIALILFILWLLRIV